MANAQDLPGSVGAAAAAHVQTDPSFQDLARQHHSLDQQLHHLASQPYLTDAQQIKAVTLKKQKLALKDRMASLAAARH